MLTLSKTSSDRLCIGKQLFFLTDFNLHSSYICFFIALTILSLPVYAVLPPKYLSVPDFKQCLSEQNEGSYSSWCQPAKKPKACPRVSWRQLRALQGNDAVPACRAK
ncbi:hypothetical protein QF022_001392 [Vogesella perlucida]|nr:hypothetical protein [Vogesella perlucida]